MTEDDLHKFLADNKAEIAQAVKVKAIEAMTRSIQYSLPDSVGKAVAEFFEAEIIPEIKAQLQDQKTVLVATAIKTAAEIGDLVSKAMVKTTTERMANGYNSNEVLKALFGVR